MEEAEAEAQAVYREHHRGRVPPVCLQDPFAAAPADGGTGGAGDALAGVGLGGASARSREEARSAGGGADTPRGSQTEWIVAERHPHFAVGEVVAAPSEKLLVRDRALLETPLGVVLAKNIQKFNRDLEVRKLELYLGMKARVEDEDVRTMSVKFNQQNERYRVWQDVCDSIFGVPLSDWPLAGPRTSLWFCLHILKNGGSPTAFLVKVLRDLKSRWQLMEAFFQQLICVVECISGLNSVCRVH
jgi:hypothetical protein